MQSPTYKYFETKANYETAQSKCEEWGGNLASLNTIKKIEFVADMLPDDTKVWIGGKCVGCTLAGDDKWMWKSGDRLDLQNPMWKEFEGQQAPWDTKFV